MRVFSCIILILFAAKLSAQPATCGQTARAGAWTSIARVDTVPPRGVLTIPIVVHILWHTEQENLSDAIVLSQIEALNRDYLGENEDQQYVPAEFAPALGKADIRFCLAAVDPSGHSTVAVERRYTDQTELGMTSDWYASARGGLDAWDPSHYLNIWVVNTGAFVTGFASYPAQNLPYNGVVIHPAYFGINDHAHYGLGRVATHEIGHYLGLLHPWADDNDCGTDDQIADTPPQYIAHGGCPSYPAAGCSPSEMFMNFMDYVDDKCMLLFTNDQASKMRTTLATARSPLANACIPCQVSNDNTFALLPYPNPTHDWVQVAFQEPPMKLVAHALYSAAGQLVQQGTSLVNDKLSLDLSLLRPGIYYLHCAGKIAKLVKI